MGRPQLYLALVVWALIPSVSYAGYVPNFIPGSLVNVSISTVCSYNAQSGTVSYDYDIKSEKSSQQNLAGLFLAFESPITGSVAPSGWTSDDMANGYWSFATDFNGTPLSPGSELGGASLVSVGLPAIETFRAKGDAPDPTLPDDLSDQEFQAFEQAADYFNNSATGSTVAPGLLTTTAPVSTIITYLTAQKENAASLNWIDNQGVVNSLDQKLLAAQRALSRGNTQACRGNLDAFEHEVLAQNGKHLNTNAFAILKTCADVALSKL